DGRRNRSHQVVRRRDLEGVSAPNPDHEVREHNREADGNQRLAQILPFHAAKDQKLHGGADDGATEESSDVAQQPGTRPFGGLVTQIAAEQVKRAVRKVDVAHQTKDQRETGGHQKVESPERNAIEESVNEEPLGPKRLFEPRWPGGEDQPDHKNDGNGKD